MASGYPKKLPKVLVGVASIWACMYLNWLSLIDIYCTDQLIGGTSVYVRMY